ncbi:hypothetical protein BD779DRAFT_1675952 [Infundibulicybe gibba]|nr:hypothetical protein BD779DRAFT_1675952 [Infundibulicybe gibba]
MPELWANIHVQIDRHQPNLPRLLDLVNIWISRSGRSTFASPDALLGVLSKCTSLVYCGICVSDDISPLALQSILPLSDDPIVLPLLQRLFLRFPFVFDYDDSNCASYFFAALRCPILRELTLMSSSSIPLSLLSLQLFYGPCSETLEFLDLGDECYEYLLETLRLLPRLTTLYADASSLLPHEAQQLGEGTIAPHLTTLGVSGSK